MFKVLDYFKRNILSLINIIFKFDIIFNRPLIIIYSMGKVGSSTLFKTLKNSLNYKYIYQVHFLTHETLERKKGDNINHLQMSREILEILKKYNNKKIYLITLVRDPISRDISDLFENPFNYLKDNDINSIPFEKLENVFNQHSFDYTLNWFNNEFNNFTKLDIYSIPYNKMKSFNIYKKRNINVLIIKTEELSACYQVALKNFLKLHIPSLNNSNRSDNKNSAKTYTDFKKKYKAPEKMLEYIYNSTFCEFFYSSNEIQNFINKWN